MLDSAVSFPSRAQQRQPPQDMLSQLQGIGTGASHAFRRRHFPRRSHVLGHPVGGQGLNAYGVTRLVLPSATQLQQELQQAPLWSAAALTPLWLRAKRFATSQTRKAVRCTQNSTARQARPTRGESCAPSVPGSRVRKDSDDLLPAGCSSSESRSFGIRLRVQRAVLGLSTLSTYGV